MSWKKLQESEYESYFDELSKRAKEKLAEIEVMAVGVSDREQTTWIPFYGITYDPPEKIVSIISEYIDHHIKKPGEVNVHEVDGGVDTIEIIGGDGYKHRLKFKTPIAG